MSLNKQKSKQLNLEQTELQNKESVGVQNCVKEVVEKRNIYWVTLKLYFSRLGEALMECI